MFVPLTRKTGYAIEVRTQEGNDEAVCRSGVLVYKVDADVDTGQGPVKVEDATPDSGGARGSRTSTRSCPMRRTSPARSSGTSPRVCG